MERIAALRLEGFTVRAIASEIGVTHVTILRDLDTILDRWKAESVRALNEYIAVEYAKICHLETEYWAAWLRSRSDRVQTKEATKNAPDGQTTTDETVTEGRDGNPAFLAGVERCIERRCKLLGLDAPTKIAPVTPDGKGEYRPTPMSQDEAVAAYREALERALSHD